MGFRLLRGFGHFAEVFHGGFQGFHFSPQGGEFIVTAGGVRGRAGWTGWTEWTRWTALARGAIRTLGAWVALVVQRLAQPLGEAFQILRGIWQPGFP